MKIVIDEDIVKKSKFNFPELLLFLSIKMNRNLIKTLKDLLDKKAVIKDDFGDYIPTQYWDDVAMNLILSSDKAVPQDDYLEELALELMGVFPQGRKEGTCHYYKGNRKDTILKLKKFFKLYGNTYTKEQIINAAKAYVESFNGNYRTMRILKYFIVKDEKKQDSEGKGYIEQVSDLASWIDNADSNTQNYSNAELR